MHLYVCIQYRRVCLIASVDGCMFFMFAFMSLHVLTPLSHPPPHVDHRPPHAARGLPAQRGVHPHAPHGRAPHRRTDAVQSRRETLPRPLLRQQAQLVSVGTI